MEDWGKQQQTKRMLLALTVGQTKAKVVLVSWYLEAYIDFTGLVTDIIQPGKQKQM